MGSTDRDLVTRFDGLLSTVIVAVCVGSDRVDETLLVEVGDKLLSERRRVGEAESVPDTSSLLPQRPQTEVFRKEYVDIALSTSIMAAVVLAAVNVSALQHEGTDCIVIGVLLLEVVVVVSALGHRCTIVGEAASHITEAMPADDMGKGLPSG